MTLPRWLTSPLWTRPELRPGRALLTAPWLAALAVMGANDQWLKGAGILPGEVTGKLSDLAGMVVAPALLAALLGLRSRRGLLWCHVAVGAVFAAIKLSPAAADAWSWVMGLVGNAWIITVDPTDLLALPMLALGWRVLVPAMTRPMPGRAGALRLAPKLAQVAAICAGTSLSVATSQGHQGDEGEGEGDIGDVGEWDTGVDSGEVFYEDIEADVYLHNGSAADMIVRTRDLLPEVQIDCIAAEEEPGLLLAESLFGAGRTWTMPANTNAAARDLSLAARECYAVRVEGDRLVAPFILFWRANDIGVETIAGSITDAGQHRPGGVLLAADGDGQVSVESSQRPIVFAIDELPPADAYMPGADVERLAWSDPPLTGAAMQITGLGLGPDGCLALEFDAGIEVPRWYLCLPADSFPFAQDQWVTVQSFASGDVIEVRRAKGPEDVEDPLDVAMVVSRGRVVPKLAETVMASKAKFDASLAPDPVCGTVARPSEISVRYEDGEVQVAEPGGKLTLQGASTSLALWFAHAEERVILNPVCAEGPDELGLDFEVVAVRSPSEP